MSRLLIAALLLLPAPLIADEKAEGFVSLFNGKDFSGWRFAKGPALGTLPKNWKVEGGLIKLSGGGSPHLSSQWDYEDFDVRFEWRSVNKDYNSGFYVRSGRMVGANQINLAKSAPGGFLGGKLKGAKAVPALQKPPTEWNEWRVLVKGDAVTFWCNGKEAWKGTEFASKRGYLGLQAEGHPMEFRNLRLRELGWETLNDLKQWKSAGWKAEGDGLAAEGKATLEAIDAPKGDFGVRLEWKATKAEVTLRGKTIPLTGLSAVKGATLSPEGQWNYAEVRVAGGEAKVWLNGDWLSLKIAVPDEGPLAIATEGAASVRNVRRHRGG